MRVTRLEIFGFKSFVDRFVLNFDKDMIGIVGPNGCGKSNIVDALRWVLGESQARQLRGNVFDDLIFNGSESRRPLGMAEVSLTVRPETGWFTSPEEVLRSQALREKDIIEELQETIDSETAETPVVESVDSVVLPEEGNPLSSLLEIPGIFEASEIQLTRRLYRSGESEYYINRVPCRLRDMVELYRLIGLGARGLSIVQQGQIGDIVSKKPVERRELLEEAAGISGFRARVEAAERKLKRSSDNLARLNDLISEVDKQVKSLRRQASKAKNRAELKDQLKASELSLYEVRSAETLLTDMQRKVRHGELVAKLTEAEATLSGARADQQRFHLLLEQFDVELASLREQREVHGRELNKRREAEEGLKIERAKLGSKERSLDEALLRLETSRESYRKDVERSRAAIAEKESELTAARELVADREAGVVVVEAAHQSPEQSGTVSDATAELTRLEQDLSGLGRIGEELKTIERELQSARTQVTQTNSQLNSKRVQVASVEAEVASLEAQLVALSEHVYAETGSARQGDDSDATVLLAGVIVPEELQAAVWGALGEKGHFVVANDAAGLLARYVTARKSSGAETRLGVIDGSRTLPQSSTVDIELLRTVAPSIRPLRESLTIRPGFEAVFAGLLTSVMLVNTLEEARAAREQLLDTTSEHFSIVTLGGEVVTEWGWYTTTGKGTGFSFTRRIEQARERAAKFNAEIASYTDALQREEAQLNQLLGDHRALKSEREALFVLQERATMLRKQIAQEERTLRDKAFAAEREAQRLLREAAKGLAEVEQSISGANHRIRHSEEELLKLDSDEARIRADKETLRETLATIEARAIAEHSSEYLAAGERLQRRYAELGEQIEVREKDRRELRMGLSEASSKVDQLRSLVDTWSKESHQLEVSFERGSVERAMLLEDIRRKYGEEVAEVSFEQAQSLASDGDVRLKVQNFEEESSRLRKRIEREGEVDPESIELYEAEQTRLDALLAQQQDLDGAIKMLERTIRQLKQISKIRFLNTFTFVSKKFSELVPRLYGGGAGTMELIDPEDPLTSGIELSVRPPGKKLRSMELLSGGEKALAATAVLVAMFLYRPSPICVLDEVDAPLDDANLERFMNIIREIAENTQFLVITHNKQTMSVVDRLIGITMQEAGISTALTVSLEEAEADLERWAVNS